MATGTQEKEYFAFISYSRKDKNVANWLHQHLEHYTYPANIVRTENQPKDKKYIRPIFIDTKDLQSEQRPFEVGIQQALQNSKFLILICSRNSAESTYVNQEVRYFLEHKGGNYDFVVPIFIDEVSELTIPPAIQGSSVMHRHFPIYESALSPQSEANKYCFLQIASYLLSINFSDIYNRYEDFVTKKKKRMFWQFCYAIIALFGIVISLSLMLWKQHQLTDFERNVFPLAVVFGYEENFLHPMITYLKENDKDFKIMVLMPSSLTDLKHQDRITDITYLMKKSLNIDSLHFEYYQTSMKRGNRAARLYKGGEAIDNIYLDFASTSTSFLKIAEYKKHNLFYKDKPWDELIREYANTFIYQTKQRLGTDSIYVEFFIDKSEMLNTICKDL